MNIKNKVNTTQLQQRIYARPQDADDPRQHYFRDATAIMHSTPFRRLKHKTQVFFAPKNDHICTRLEHVLHVASISVTICKALELDTDLAWAIGLGHDLGHTPFGHLGETLISTFTNRTFCHELHSLRVVDKLNMLNLTYAARDGIVTHCGEKFEQAITPSHHIEDLESYHDRTHYPTTFEGCIVRMADKIAYLGRDYEDAITLGLLSPDDMPLPITHILGGSDNSNIINSFTRDLIAYTKKHNTIGFSEQVHEALLILKEYNYKNIYKSTVLTEQSERFKTLLEIVYEQLYTHIEKYQDDIEAYHNDTAPIVQNLHHHLTTHNALYNLHKAESRIDALIDYIAGMTDDYVISIVKNKLFSHPN